MKLFFSIFCFFAQKSFVKQKKCTMFNIQY